MIVIHCFISDKSLSIKLINVDEILGKISAMRDQRDHVGGRKSHPISGIIRFTPTLDSCVLKTGVLRKASRLYEATANASTRSLPTVPRMGLLSTSQSFSSQRP